MTYKRRLGMHNINAVAKTLTEITAPELWPLHTFTCKKKVYNNLKYEAQREGGKLARFIINRKPVEGVYSKPSKIFAIRGSISKPEAKNMVKLAKELKLTHLDVEAFYFCPA